MTAPRVAVTPSRNTETGEIYLNPRIQRALIQCGVEPVLIVHEDMREGHLPSKLQGISGLLLPGGPDAHPRYFGEEAEPGCGSIWEEQDELEFSLMDWAVRAGKPILGICRGVQMINVFLGGTLYQDLPTDLGLCHRQSDGEIYFHEVTFERDTLPGRLIGGKRHPVNSYHHQSIKRVADGLRVTARSDDGVIEAVEGVAGQFILGLQWHPETTYGQDELSRAIFEEFARQLACEP